MSELVVQVPPLAPEGFPWDGDPSGLYLFAFKIVAGPVMIMPGYAVCSSGVLLTAVTIIQQQTSIWRRFWTSKEAAVDRAEHLIEDCEDYLCGTLGLRIREVEDLGADDFIEHLRLRLANAFH